MNVRDTRRALTPRMLLVAAFVVGTLGGVAAHAADLKAGEAKAKEVCAACHGMDGNSQVPDYPKIGGQYPDYLAKALRDYKDGKRKNPIMAGMAAPLTRADIENLAAYYAAQPATVHNAPK